MVWTVDAPKRAVRLVRLAGERSLCHFLEVSAIQPVLTRPTRLQAEITTSGSGLDKDPGSTPSFVFRGAIVKVLHLPM